MERVSGEVLDKTVREEISQNLPDKQGYLQMTGIQNGLYHSEEWRVLERNDNFMLGENSQVERPISPPSLTLSSAVIIIIIKLNTVEL